MEVDRFLTMRRRCREIYRPPGGEIKNVNNERGEPSRGSLFASFPSSLLPALGTPITATQDDYVHDLSHR